MAGDRKYREAEIRRLTRVLDDSLAGRPLTGPPPRPDTAEQDAAWEVDRLVHLHEHGRDPVDLDDCDFESYEIERLLAPADAQD